MEEHIEQLKKDYQNFKGNNNKKNWLKSLIVEKKGINKKFL